MSSGSLLVFLFEGTQHLSREGLHRALGKLRVDAGEMHARYEVGRPHLARELLEAFRNILRVAHDRGEQQRIGRAA